MKMDRFLILRRFQGVSQGTIRTPVPEDWLLSRRL